MGNKQGNLSQECFQAECKEYSHRSFDVQQQLPSEPPFVRENMKRNRTDLMLIKSSSTESIDSIVSINQEIEDHLENQKKDPSSSLSSFAGSGSASSVGIENFQVIKIVGQGSFGKVYQIIHIPTKQAYAMKVIRKQSLPWSMTAQEENRIKTERNILASIEHPFILNLKYSFQTDTKLFFVVEFFGNGDLYSILKKCQRLDEESARFCAAQIVLAIDYLHKELKVLHRDIKPENIMVDDNGYLRLCDFGLSKILECNGKNGSNAYSFVGTAEYNAPEVIEQLPYSYPADWWSFGVLLYELIIGTPPFVDEDKDRLRWKIIKQKIEFPKDLISARAMKFLSRILEPEVESRLIDVDEIKSDPFFNGIDWEKLLRKEFPVPLMMSHHVSSSSSSSSSMLRSPDVFSPISPPFPDRPNLAEQWSTDELPGTNTDSVGEQSIFEMESEENLNDGGSSIPANLSLQPAMSRQQSRKIFEDEDEDGNGIITPPTLSDAEGNRQNRAFTNFSFDYRKPEVYKDKFAPLKDDDDDMPAIS